MTYVVNSWNHSVEGVRETALLHERFDFMRDILSLGSSGLMLVIDSLYPETFEYALNILERIQHGRPIPTVILANKQDLEGALTPEMIREEIQQITDREIPIIPVSGLRGDNLDVALRTLIEMIRESEGETGNEPGAGEGENGQNSDNGEDVEE